MCWWYVKELWDSARGADKDIYIYRLCVLERALWLLSDPRSSVLAMMMFFVSLYARRFAIRSAKGMLENKGRNEHYLSICITNRGLVRSIMRYHGGRTIFVELKERTIGFASCP
jgi:hypothetical protein